MLYGMMPALEMFQQKALAFGWRKLPARLHISGREPVDALSVDTHYAEARAAAPRFRGRAERSLVARLNHSAPCSVARITRPDFRKQLLAYNRMNAVRSH